MNDPEYNTDDGCNPSPYSGSCNIETSMNIEESDGPSEGLRIKREKLEKRNKKMLEKKTEDIRVKQEIALTKKLHEDLDKSIKNLDYKDEKNKKPIVTEINKQGSLDEIVKELLENTQKLQSSSNHEERFDSSKTNIKGLIYNITLLKISTKNTKLESSKINSASKLLKDNYCHSITYKRLKDAGFNLTSSYSASNGDLLYEVTANPSDCQQSPPKFR